jgi:hypothetical protein
MMTRMLGTSRYLLVRNFLTAEYLLTLYRYVEVYDTSIFVNLQIFEIIITCDIPRRFCNFVTLGWKKMK